jgi:uncharacterized heparinase superfamily protein
MSKTAPLSELQLLVDLMSRVQAVAKARNTTPGEVVKGITRDSKLWRAIMLRHDHLAAVKGGGRGSPDPTRSITLEMRDRILAGLTAAKPQGDENGKTSTGGPGKSAQGGVSEQAR